MNFSERLEKLLEEKNIKRTAFAADIGILNQSISDWKKRNTIPSGDIVYKISKYLNVSMSYLINGEEADQFTESFMRAYADIKGKDADFNPKPVFLTTEEEQILSGYSFLSKRSKAILRDVLNSLIENDTEEEK